MNNSDNNENMLINAFVLDMPEQGIRRQCSGWLLLALGALVYLLSRTGARRPTTP